MCKSTCPHMEARGEHQLCQLLLQLTLLKQDCSLNLELTDLVRLPGQWGPEVCLSLPPAYPCPVLGYGLTQPYSVFIVDTGSQSRSLSKHVTHWDILCFSIFKENGRGACFVFVTTQHHLIRGLGIAPALAGATQQYPVPPSALSSTEYKAVPPYTHTSDTKGAQSPSLVPLEINHPLSTSKEGCLYLIC